MHKMDRTRSFTKASGQWQNNKSIFFKGHFQQFCFFQLLQPV